MMRRKVVLREVCTPKRAAKRTPPLPQVARPIEVMCSLSLVVIRAHGSVSCLRRSVKTDAANSRDCGKRIYAPSEKAEAGVRHTQRLSKFDGSSYGCETKAVNRADNRIEDELRSLRLPDQPPRCGSGRFPFLLGGKEVLLLSCYLSLTVFPLHTRSLHTRESSIACQVHRR
jgi:hypothetical protein